MDLQTILSKIELNFFNRIDQRADWHSVRRDEIKKEFNSAVEDVLITTYSRVMKDAKESETMVLEDLKKSITKMPTEELMALILELRASRRIRKEKPAAKKAAAKSDASLDKAIIALSPAQRQKLLELLGGSDATDIKLDMIPLQLIDEGKRAREEYGNLQELIESFKAEGVIQPIAVKTTPTGYRLLAGGRRLRAMKTMGMELAPCRIYPADLTEIEEKSIELAENLNRLDLSWLEKIRLCEQIHNLQIAIHGEKTSTLPDADGWSKRDTARMLEKSPASIVQDIMLAEAVERIPELRECSTKDEAKKAAIDDAGNYD